MHIKKLASCVAIAALSTGCSMMAPQYSASIENVQTLKNSGETQVSVGQFAFTPGPGNTSPITIRAASMNSPYGNSYGAFLAAAIQQELTLANRYTPTGNLEVSGVLLKNDIDAAGFSVGYVTVEARFVVKRNGATTYDKVKSVKQEFPSSFAGAVAIPKAVQEYNVAVQKLLGLVYEDKAFADAIK
ncbi:hypothetical protein [Undibacterium pigrum]|uniref:Lipoprotein n=1 Tax=Undibacterium pigrum TaxID=401470 RepID=A0A318J5V3_9BURK|nr:hypothetical protein [Undibacterium pigrum]PXX44182.1 hypothetical protein DFR42_103451 [Undibacterium pigrum]